MATARKRILVSFTNEERANVDALADQVKLSVSELLRRLALGQRLPNPNDFAGAQAIRDLLKINADQARLGNLLKLALNEIDGPVNPAMVARIDGLVVEIQDIQAAIKDSVKALHHQIHPRAAR